MRTDSRKIAPAGTWLRRFSPLLVAVAALAALPFDAAQAQTRATPSAANERGNATHASRAFWQDQRGAIAASSARGTERSVQATKLRALTLDRASLVGHLAGAPMERSDAARSNPLVLALPAPDGRFQRFRVVESPVMEPGLAARHPHIKTYSGRGIDDAGATLRITVSQLGVMVSVRGSQGTWYIDPVYRNDQSLYASYFTRDLPRRADFARLPPLGAQVAIERGRYRAAEAVDVRGAGYAPGTPLTITVRNVESDAQASQTLFATADAEGTFGVAFTADPYRRAGSYEVNVSDGRNTSTSRYIVVADGQPLNAVVGTQLRTYRLALLTDPSYAAYHAGQGSNTTAAKVVLVNRVTQIYEDETSIRLVLINNNDALNLDTAAQFSGANGPCGAAACFSTATVSCSGATLTRTRTVIGLIVGASSFDVGHIAVAAGGGGIASLGVVGGSFKAQGCTGLNPPTGDFFAVDYVAHEIGHQYGANHTFNGVTGSCSGGNRSAANSVEPGSGSSIMAYAGICGSDNIQPNSDPYWSMRSFDEVVNLVSSAESNLSEQQQAALRFFTTNGQQFQLRFGGNNSVPIVRGTNFTAADIQNAITGIAGWPAGGTVTVSSVTDGGFTINFGGSLAGVPVASLELVNCTGGCSGFVGEIVAGGPTARGGVASPTGNTGPTVTVPAQVTIPIRTPFVLSGSATDPNGDPLTFMWEQTDRGGTTGTALTSNTKTNGPLFRQFGTRQVVADPTVYNPPGQNAPTAADSTRVFPDLPQILINNTNAETGSCPVAGFTATQQNDCFSEFLPTAAYVGFAGVNAGPPVTLNFRLTARDGNGGVGNASTSVALAPGAGPFLVTAPNTGIDIDAGWPLTVTWDVANTAAAPVNTANVRITLSTDGGLTYPTVLASSTPNDGSQAVSLPNVATTQARIRVEAVGNIFFDVSNVNFRMRLAGDVDGDGALTCADVGIVRRAFGTSVGQPGFDARADINRDGAITILDVRYVRERLDPSLLCF